MNHLIVYDDSVLTESVSRDGGHARDRFLLAPLTSRVQTSTELQQRLRDQGLQAEVAPTAELLNQAADRVRGPYVDFIAELPNRIRDNGADLKSLFALDERASLWWFSLIAEKSTFKSDSFNRLCQLDMLVEVNRHIRADGVNCYSFSPFHGTPLREMAEKLGYIDSKTIARSATKPTLLKMPEFPPEMIEGLRRCFVLYVKMPKYRWPEIRKAEAPTPEGNRLWAQLRDECAEKYVNQTRRRSS